MDEHLQGHGQIPFLELSLKALEILQGELASKHDAFAAGISRLCHTSSTGDRHLRGPMQRQARNQLLGQHAQAQVLDDEGIDSRLLSGHQQLCCSCELIAEHQHVEGEKTAHAPGMQPSHDFGQVVQLKVFCP